MKKDTSEARMADAIVTTIKKALAPLQVKIADLEQRFAAHEAEPFLKDAGVWRHGSQYHVGDVATFKGSAWSCTVAHTAHGPVADHAYWRLMYKGAAR